MKTILIQNTPEAKNHFLNNQGASCRWFVNTTLINHVPLSPLPRNHWETCVLLMKGSYLCLVSWKCLSRFCFRMVVCIYPSVSESFLSLRLIAREIWLKWVKISCHSGQWSVGSLVWGCRKGRHSGVYKAKEITLGPVGGKEKNRARVLLSPSRDYIQLPIIFPLGPIW